MHSILVLCLCVLGGDQLSQDVQIAARRFRIHAYSEFRTDRGEYERHTKLVERVLEQWTESHPTRQNVDELKTWLNRVRSTQPGSPLPLPPVFADVDQPQTTTPGLAPPEPPAPVESSNTTPPNDVAYEAHSQKPTSTGGYLNPFDRQGDRSHGLVGRFGRAIIRGLANSANESGQ